MLLQRQNAFVFRKALIAVLLALSCWALDRVASRQPAASPAPAIASQHHHDSGGASAPVHHDDAAMLASSAPAAASTSAFQHVSDATGSARLFRHAVRVTLPSIQRTRGRHPGLRDIPLLI
jgi:hypothetical protein